jgi:MFS family permease
VTEPPLSLRGDQALALVTAFLALFSIVGIGYYGPPFFYDKFVTELGWTRQQVTSGNALAKLLVGPLFGFLAGVVIDRFGARRLMLAGIVMGGVALIGLGGTTTLAGFYFFYLFNALGYVCGGPLPNQVLLSRFFDAARGKAMGFAYLGIGIGGALVPLLAHALIEALGWRVALRVLGVLIVVAAFPAAFFVRDPPSAGGSKDAGPVPAPIRSVLRSPAFFFLALGSMASIGAIGGTIQNLKLYLSLDKAMAEGLVAEVLSLILVGSLFGRVAMGFLADRWSRKHVMLLIYLIVASTIPLLAVAPSPAALRTAALLFGVGLGGDYMIIPLMAADLFGLRVMGRLMGIILTADGVAEAVVPMGVAAVRDRAGSYGPGFLLLVGLAALGAVAVALLPARSPGARSTRAPS